MAGTALDLDFITQAGGARERVAIDRLIIAGWTGRNREKMEEHVAELEKLGVARPASFPTFYRVAAARLTTESEIQVSGDKSSGEVEFVLLRHGGRTWVGVGSDHTDREVETYGVTVSKQMCDKPVGPRFWALDEVADHWDQLKIRSEITEGGGSVVYQEGTVAAMLSPDALLAALAEQGAGLFDDGTAMMGGTLPAIGGIRSAAEFRFSLEDPVLGRSLSHGYKIVSLPIAG